MHSTLILRYLPALLCILSLTAGGTDLAARQTGDPATEGFDYGLSFYGARSVHSADLDSLPGIPQARERFTSGTGTGWSAFGLFRLPLSGPISASLRGGVSHVRGVLTAYQTEPSTPDGTPVPMTIRHTLDASFTQLAVAPMLEWSFLGRLRLAVGPEFGLLLDSRALQTEDIIDPPGATWVTTGEPRQVLYDDAVEGAARFQTSINVGIGYTLPLSGNRLFVAPELFASVPLTRLRPEGDWSAVSYRAGVSLFFTAAASEPPPVEETEYRYDTLLVRDTTVRIIAGIDREQIVLDTVETVSSRESGLKTEEYHTVITERYVRQIPELKPLLSAGVSTSFVLDNGRETRAAKVTMEEFIVNKYVPLLPYVFFAERSAVLEERYRRLSPDEATAFTINRYNKAGALDIYYHVLNIVGQRMRGNPGAVLTVTGYTAAEPGAPSLADDRARAVAAYLSHIWNIPSSRLVVRARTLPEHPSSMAQPEGVDENRRVELTSSDPSLFDPVVLTDTLRTVDPPTVRFRTRLFSEAGVRQWHILITQGDKPLKELHGEGPPPPIVDWQIGRDDIRPVAALPLEYRLAVTDSTGQSFITPKGVMQFEQITISKKKLERRADKVIDRFSLLLFDYDAATLSQRHESTLQFIRSRLAPSSTVRIIGTTDRVGDSGYNRLLSEKRAQETARVLSAQNAVILGEGEDTTTFSNDVPEGRLYSRTVRISIETPFEAR